MLQNTQYDYRAVVKYANAYHKVGIDSKSKILDEIKQLLKTFESNKDFNIIFKSPLLNKKQQAELIISLFSDKKDKKIIVSKDLFGLIILLAKNSRLNILQEVLKRYIQLHTSDNKEIKVHVTSVIKISDNLEEQLKKNLSKNGKMKVKVINLIDKDLLGGLIIQIGSNLIDTSIRTKLNKVKNAMKGAN